MKMDGERGASCLELNRRGEAARPGTGLAFARDRCMRETPTGPQQEGADVLTERDRIDRLSRVRDLVFGSLDGLIVPLGVVSGVAGGIGDSRAVIVAGIAEAFAGALSMGAGEFIAGRSEAQVQQTEVRKELAEMRAAPKYEFDELVHIYEQEGMSTEDAKLLVATLARYPGVYEKAMVAQELGIPTLEPETAKISAAMTIGVSYIVGSIVPLAAYFFFRSQSRCLFRSS